MENFIYKVVYSEEGSTMSKDQLREAVLAIVRLVKDKRDRAGRQKKKVLQNWLKSAALYLDFGHDWVNKNIARIQERRQESAEYDPMPERGDIPFHASS